MRIKKKKEESVLVQAVPVLVLSAASYVHDTVLVHVLDELCSGADDSVLAVDDVLVNALDGIFPAQISYSAASGGL